MPSLLQSGHRHSRPRQCPSASLVLLLVCAAAGALEAAEDVHVVRSSRQTGETTVRVFTPKRKDIDRPMRTLYVLPVEAGTETRWGDPAEEIRKLDIADRYGLAVALPTFSAVPWYADHPSNMSLRQEQYLLEDVLPLVEGSYPVETGPDGRLLVGFSKSGWGAWSLLLRHPGVFGKAAAWDAPLMQDAPDRFGMEPIFGDQENFEQYRITGLIRSRAASPRQRCCLVLTGYAGAFRAHHTAMHELLVELAIPHAYRDGPQREHQWHSGWLEEAVSILVADCGRINSPDA